MVKSLIELMVACFIIIVPDGAGSIHMVRLIGTSFRIILIYLIIAQ